MAHERAPFMKLPLAFDQGRLRQGELERSVRDNIRLILHNQVQGVAKPPGVAADPTYGAELPHHEFRHGRIQDVVREVRVAVRRLEPRLDVEKVDFLKKRPGRFLPYSTVRISGTLLATGESFNAEFEIEE
jgi:phage baseplate assembly protein W